MHDYAFFTENEARLYMQGNPSPSDFYLYPHEEMEDMTPDFVAIYVEKDNEGKLQNFNITTTSSDRSPRDSESTRYDFSTDGELTVEKAAELIDIFTLAIT